MPRVEMDVETWLPPEKVREALIDFSERRPELWPSIDPTQYEVYSVGETSAEVKEGSKLPGKTIWAKEHYDWSSPDTVRWTVTDSNFCEPGSYVAATMHPREGGGTRIHIQWERTGKGFTNRLMLGLIKLTKGKPIASSVRKTLTKLEQEAPEGESPRA